MANFICKNHPSFRKVLLECRWVSFVRFVSVLFICLEFQSENYCLFGLCSNRWSHHQGYFVYWDWKTKTNSQKKFVNGCLGWLPMRFIPTFVGRQEWYRKMWNIIKLIKCLTFILIFIFIEDFQSDITNFVCFTSPGHSLTRNCNFHFDSMSFTFFLLRMQKESIYVACYNGKLTNFDWMHCVFHLQTMETFLLLIFLWHLRKCSLLAGMCTFCRYFHQHSFSKNAAALLLPPKQTTAHPNRLNSTYN